MEINLEALEQIPQLVAKIDELLKLQKEGNIEKKWLNSKELAHYLGFSEDKVYKLVQHEWIENVHYHKPTGKLIFDKNKIDEWVVKGSDICVDGIVEGVLAEVTL